EQALCSAIDHRADLFSVGVVLWELVTGMRFWGNLSEVQIIKKMTFGELPKLREVRPDLPSELGRILDRSLAVMPTSRYDNAAEMREDIDKFARREGMIATPIDVSRLVTELFGEQRSEVRTAIRAHGKMDEERSITGSGPASVSPASGAASSAL